jgi:hypothetical protein
VPASVAVPDSEFDDPHPVVNEAAMARAAPAVRYACNWPNIGCPPASDEIRDPDHARFTDPRSFALTTHVPRKRSSRVPDNRLPVFHWSCLEIPAHQKLVLDPTVRFDCASETCRWRTGGLGIRVMRAAYRNKARASGGLSVAKCLGPMSLNVAQNSREQTLLVRWSV